MDRKLDQSHPTVINVPSAIIICLLLHIWTKATLCFESTCTLCARGVCSCCKSELESIQLTAAEYQQLKDRVMADVIQGRDVFTKTTPEVRTHTLIDIILFRAAYPHHHS